jgi:hypothetical protein
MSEHQDKLHTIITLQLVLHMDAKHGIFFRVNNKNNYMFSNKVLRKVLGTMKADVGNLCISDCEYDYLAYVRFSGTKCKTSGMMPHRSLRLPTFPKNLQTQSFWST